VEDILSGIMLGTITVSQHGRMWVHTYTAPDDGWCVNTHILEFTTQLLVIDAQCTLPYAREVLAYAQALGKPISRHYITHYHPDHLLGAVVFQVPLYALAEVKAKIEAVGDRVASEEHEKCGDRVASYAERPSHIVMPGIEAIEGTRIEFIRLQHAETENALIIAFPDQRILITQDLVYHRVHCFVGEKAFDTWARALEAYRELGYGTILPGHGSPGGPELYDEMLHYLSVVRDEFSKAADGEDLKRRLFAAFPDYGGRLMVDHEMRFLFPQENAADSLQPGIRA
jgi:glyoxylase-like metal-dependent hydrolase (beta-lactamase superfamily II)